MDYLIDVIILLEIHQNPILAALFLLLYILLDMREWDQIKALF